MNETGQLEVLKEALTLDRLIEWADGRGTVGVYRNVNNPKVYEAIAVSLRRLRELEQSSDFDEGRAEACRQCIEISKALKECEAELRAVKSHYGDRR